MTGTQIESPLSNTWDPLETGIPSESAKGENRFRLSLQLESANDGGSFEAVVVQANEECNDEAIKPGKNVRFGEVLIHFHLIILSPPPAIPIIGPPISISWKKMSSRTLSIEEFEEMRGTPRPYQKLKIPSSVRSAWLREIGYKRSQIEYAAMLAASGGNGEGLGDVAPSGRISEGGGKKRKKANPPRPKAGKSKSGRGCLSGCFGKDPACE